MRVLHLTAGNLFGGVETALISLASCGLKDLSLQTTFACCFTGRLSQVLIDKGASVHFLGEVRIRFPWTVWRARRKFT